MPRVNPETLDRLEARELRQRQQISQRRAIRRGLHQVRFSAEPKLFVCPDCGGDCKTLMVAMQASLKAGRQ